jgi:hypothetical protein
LQKRPPRTPPQKLLNVYTYGRLTDFDATPVEAGPDKLAAVIKLIGLYLEKALCTRSLEFFGKGPGKPFFAQKRVSRKISFSSAPFPPKRGSEWLM